MTRSWSAVPPDGLLLASGRPSILRWMVVKSISHHIETIDNKGLWYFRGNHHSRGLRWCRMSSIHSLDGYKVAKIQPGIGTQVLELLVPFTMDPFFVSMFDPQPIHKTHHVGCETRWNTSYLPSGSEFCPSWWYCFESPFVGFLNKNG